MKKMLALLLALSMLLALAACGGAAASGSAASASAASAPEAAASEAEPAAVQQ